MFRLVPMNEAEFRESFERAVVRHAANAVRRGEWAKEAAPEASRKEILGFHPQGRETPGHHFVKVVDESNGKQVGEAWYTVQPQGGKVRFWVEWLWTDPQQRRRGYATAVLQQLSHEAAKQGAEKIGLYVFLDNPQAVALYNKLGFTTVTMGMTRPVKL